MLGITAALLLQLAAPSGAAAESAFRTARQAQATFERVRRANLPIERGGFRPASGCDAIVGRFCYWYDSTETDPPPEAARIVRARVSLLQALDSLAVASPRDGWITGQRVRYLIEARREADALTAARACRAETWWCSALEGLALHRLDRFVESDSAFDRALASMDEARRCEWLDLRRVLGPPLSSQLGAIDCAARMRWAERVWIVADPLWSTPGRELRTEHLSRWTMSTLLERAANAHGMTWSDDTEELLLRYGGAEWYTRELPSPHSVGATSSTIGHDREPSYAFYPAVQTLSALDSLDEASWQLRFPKAASRYAPRYPERLTSVAHQLVRFPRGRAMELGVVFDVSDTALVRDTLRAHVFPDEATAAADVHLSRRWLTAVVPADSLLLSVELVGERSKRAARARYHLAPIDCASGCLSDLLLYRASEYGGTYRDSALAHGLATLRHDPSDALGVMWELRPGDAEAAVRYDVSVTPIGTSAVRRLAARLRLARDPASVRIQWMGVARADAPLDRLVLQLPANLSGRHLVRLTINTGTGRRFEAERVLVLGRR